jgi:hypothetical protein
MSLRCIGPAWVAALVILSAAGCKKSESGPAATPAKSSTPAVQTVARIHWLGRKQLAAGKNAASFMEIWNLPASKKLGAQTLDKLSLAPWRLLKGDAATNGAPIARLRPLLEDLVQEESYLEIRNATNLPGELVFAIHLSPARSGLWETNLATVLASLTGIQPVPATGGHRGWSITKHNQPKRIEFTRTGDWTLVGLSPEKNALLDDFVARITRDHAPFNRPATNFWLDADFDLHRVSSALGLGWNLPEELPQISLTVIGDGKNVDTRGKLNFPQPLSLDLAPWNVPTNLVHDPLISFTAIRGVRPWLASHEFWNHLKLGAPPNQLYFWTLQASPFQTYFAAPLADTGNQVHALSGRLLQSLDPWVATNGWGSLQPPSDSNGLVWARLPFMSPFLKMASVKTSNFVFAGLSSNVLTNQPPPAGLFAGLLRNPNLVYYDWELTGPRLERWIPLSQMFRMLWNKPQFLLHQASWAWLRALAPLKALTPKLGNSVTVVTRTAPDQLSFVRQSSIGCTAIELSALADWLESPQFPLGLYTTRAPMPPVIPVPRK